MHKLKNKTYSMDTKYAVIATIIAIILLFYYGIMFTDTSYSMVLGTKDCKIVSDCNYINNALTQDSFALYGFILVLLSSLSILTIVVYKIFITTHHTKEEVTEKLVRKVKPSKVKTKGTIR